MMDMDVLSMIGFVGLLLLSAFFSASETAIIGSRAVTLTDLANKGSTSSRRVLKLLENPGDFLATILIGNTLANITAAAIGAMLWGPAKATIIVTLAVLLIGEIPPKTFAAHWPEAIARAVSFPIWLLQTVLTPIVWLITTIMEFLLFPLTKKINTRRSFFSRDELRTALHQSQHGGELEPGEAQMVKEILDLDKIAIKEIMIPADEVAAVYKDWTIQQVSETFRRRKFTRYPVLLPNTKKPIGMLHIKDLLLYDKGEPWQNHIHPLPPRSLEMPADELLRDMQIHRYHMAKVIDAKEKVVGYITMETILEEIVGVIADEHSRETDPVTVLDSGKYLVRGDLEMADIALILNVNLPLENLEMTVEKFYKIETEDGRTSAIHIGRVLLKKVKKGYLIELFEEHDDSDDENEKQNSFTPFA